MAGDGVGWEGEAGGTTAAVQRSPWAGGERRAGGDQAGLHN